MSEKTMSPSLDATLAHVDPNRRRFLGLLLAGVAAAPLLVSERLSAATGEHFPKSQLKSQNQIKSGSAIKSDRAVKQKGSNRAIKQQNMTVKGTGKPQ
jgi:hypothetical protein